MLEALIAEAGILKRLIDSIKDLITDVQFEAGSDGIICQSMDSSHVSLVKLEMKASGFEHYRVDRTEVMGINLTSLQKILKCASNDDAVTLKFNMDSATTMVTGSGGQDQLQLMFESKNAMRISHFTLKMIDIDEEKLGVPETPADVVIKMLAAKFQRVVRECSSMADTVHISVTKEGVKFACNGDTGSGTIAFASRTRQTTHIHKTTTTTIKASKSVSVDEDDDNENERITISTSSKKKPTFSSSALLKPPVQQAADPNEDEDSEDVVILTRTQDMSATFGLRYLVSFAKATPLSKFVYLRMVVDAPLIVEYNVQTTETEKDFARLRYYLAPKIDEEPRESVDTSSNTKHTDTNTNIDEDTSTG